MTTRTSAARGFTLIELMVAIFITAMLLAMGYGAVNQAFANHAALDARQERLLAVQTTMRLFTQDLTQLTPRPVRQPLGVCAQRCSASPTFWKKAHYAASIGRSSMPR